MPSPNRLHLTLLGVSATFTGVGLSRFSYSALLPELIQQGWFSESDAAYLGAANLLGYAKGALLASRLLRFRGATQLIRWACVVIFASFLACAWPTHFVVFFLARLLSGMAGGILLATAPPVILGLITRHRQRISGYVFSGIGLGIFLAATLIPFTVKATLTGSWLMLAILALIPCGLWWRYGNACSIQRTASSDHHSRNSSPGLSIAVILVMLCYGLDAFGYIPHSLFWIDYLNRYLHFSYDASAFQWMLFGFGAMISPILIGSIAQKWGWHISLLTAFLIKTLCIAIPLFTHKIFLLSFSSFMVGALVPGMVSLVSGRLSELTPPTFQIRVWGMATAVFAITQGLSSYFFASVYGRDDTTLWLFMPASLVMLTATLIMILLPWLPGSHRVVDEEQSRQAG